MFDLIEIVLIISVFVISLFLLKGLKELKSSGKIYTVKQQIYFSEQFPSSKKKNRNYQSNKPDRSNSDSYDEDEDYLPFG